MMEETAEYDRVRALLTSPPRPVLITGKAGTGKSTLIKAIAEKREYDSNVLLLASTGIAARVIGGMTIHSFFKLPLQVLTPEIIRGHSASITACHEVVRRTPLIIVDEVSMVRPDVLDAIDTILRHCMDRHDVAFGGKRICMFGDPLQLPPVISDTDQGELSRMYGRSDVRFFDAACFRDGTVTRVELEKVFRQTDPAFMGCLGNLRVGRDVADVVEFLNRSCGTRPADDVDALVVTARRATADRINAEGLQELRSRSRIYHADASGTYLSAEVGGDLPAPKMLELRSGARVIFRKNHPEGHWVNGSLATVVRLYESSVDVVLRDPRASPRIVSVGKEMWWDTHLVPDPQSKGLIKVNRGSYNQLPLDLAWAVTIHKAQGQTFDAVHVDLGEQGAFESGQLYVAASRCRTLERLTFARPVQEADVLVDSRSLKFMSIRQAASSSNPRAPQDFYTRRRDVARPVQAFSLCADARVRIECASGKGRDLPHADTLALVRAWLILDWHRSANHRAAEEATEHARLVSAGHVAVFRKQWFAENCCPPIEWSFSYVEKIAALGVISGSLRIATTAQAEILLGELTSAISEAKATLSYHELCFNAR